jgi:hypothetical protein
MTEEDNAAYAEVLRKFEEEASAPTTSEDPDFS